MAIEMIPTSGTIPREFPPKIHDGEQRWRHLVKAQLDEYGGDDPSLWPLRRELVALHRKRDELVAQLGGGRRK
jgi:hypothetical protein